MTFFPQAPHISTTGTTTMATVSISREGGGRFRPELTRCAWGCSDTSQFCTTTASSCYNPQWAFIVSAISRDYRELFSLCTNKTRSVERGDHIKRPQRIIFPYKRQGWLCGLRRNQSDPKKTNPSVYISLTCVFSDAILPLGQQPNMAVFPWGVVSVLIRRAASLRSGGQGRRKEREGGW